MSLLVKNCEPHAHNIRIWIFITQDHKDKKVLYASIVTDAAT